MLGVFFWVVLLLSFLFSGYTGFRPTGDRWIAGGGILVCILFVLLGLKVFLFQP